MRDAVVIAVCLVAGTSAGCAAPVQGVAANYKLSRKGVALEGYDPVAYIDNGAAVEGESAIAHVYEGATDRLRVTHSPLVSCALSGDKWLPRTESGLRSGWITPGCGMRPTG